MATLNYDNTKVDKLYYQNTEVKKCYYQNVLIYESGFPKPSSTTPGDIITWDDKEWLVCHYDSSNQYVYLITKDVITTSSSDTYFNNSNVAQCLQSFDTTLSSFALSRCVYKDDCVSYGTSYYLASQVVTQPQLNGEFSWFNSNDHRIAYYNGSPSTWWTRTSGGGLSNLYIANSDGSITSIHEDNGAGVRPFVCVYMGDYNEQPSSTTPGDVITWAGNTWIVFHYDSEKKQVYLITKDIIGTAAQQSSGTNYTFYNGPAYNMVKDFINGFDRKDYLRLQPWGYGMNAGLLSYYDLRYDLGGRFPYFDNNEHRKSNGEYWSTTWCFTNETLYVDSSGWINKNGSYSSGTTSKLIGATSGVRPAVIVQMDI